MKIFSLKQWLLCRVIYVFLIIFLLISIYNVHLICNFRHHLAVNRTMDVDPIVSVGNESDSSFVKYGYLKTFFTGIKKNGFKNPIDEFFILNLVSVLLITLIMLLMIRREKIFSKVGKSINDLSEQISELNINKHEPLNYNTSSIVEINSIVDVFNDFYERLYSKLESEKKFAATTAHELKSPLAALSTCVQIALHTRGMNVFAQKNALENVLPCIDRCVYIVQQLLTLSHISEFSDINFSYVDLRSLTVEIIANLSALVVSKNIKIRVNFVNPAYVFGKLSLLSILIRNLLDNAIKYSYVNGIIKISILPDQRGEHLVLSVCDDGPGIKPGMENKIFQRFFRCCDSGVSGSGLGLSIVKQIAEIHYAKIVVFKVKWAYSGFGIKVIFKTPNFKE